MSDLLANFFNAPYSHPNDIAWYLDLARVLIRVLISMMFILLIVPPLVWAERRLLGFMQQRQGPNRVGPWGLLQTIADGVKLLMKEDIVPSRVDKTLYVLAPVVMLIPALVTTAVIPWNASKVWGAAAPNANIGILYVLAMSSLGVYGIVLAGWSSNNKYALLGGLRSSAQMISYELGMGLAIVTAVLMTGSLGLQSIVADQSGYWSTPGLAHLGIGFPQWHIFQFFPMGFTATIIYIIAAIAETNRAPFDLPEAETELVAGYHTEYTSMKFAMFFMGEYANMVVVSAVAATLWFGGFQAPIPWLGELPANLKNLYHTWNADWLTYAVDALIPAVWLILKIFVGLYVFIWIRATLPRLRYDMLMTFGWKGLLPIALVNILCVAIAMAANSYLVGLGVWLAFAVIALLVVANLKVTKLFTTKTRRQSTVRLYSTAQPYRVVGEAAALSAAGGSSRPVLESEANSPVAVDAEEKV
jgi:NADH-quinone oxidoreductase subunit H